MNILDNIVPQKKNSKILIDAYKFVYEWRSVLHYIAGVILIIGFLIPLGVYLIKNDLYLVGKTHIYRNLIYIAFVSSFFYTYLLLKYYDNIRVLVVNVIGICLAVLLLTIYGSVVDSYLVYLSILILASYIWLISSDIQLLRIEKIYFQVILLLLALFSLFLPYFQGQKINAESFVVHEYINVKNNNSFNVEVKGSDAIKVSNNYDNLHGTGFNSIPIPIILNEIEDGVEIKGTLGQDLSLTCLFIKTEIDNYNKNIHKLIECNKTLSSLNNTSLLTKVNYINNLEYINNIYKEIIIKKIDNIYVNFVKDSYYPNYETMLIRGYTMHHYNSILQGFSGGYFDSFYNQYGFGPISVVKFLSYTFNLTNFDGIYLSIYIVNFFVLLFVLVLFKLEPIMLIGYIFSIFIVYIYSAIFAPFLYYIRALPSILIVLLFVSKYSEYRFSKVLLFILFYVSGLYSKEYGFITMVSAFAVAYYTKIVKYYLYTFLSLFGLITGYLLAMPPIIYNANYLALFLGFGIVGFSFVQIIWPVLLCVTIFIVYKSQKNNKYDVKLLYPAIFLILASVKCITNPSPNHISFLLIVLTAIVYRLKEVNYRNANQLTTLLIVSIGIIFIISFRNIGFQQYNKDLSAVYVDSPVSKIFKVDKYLVDTAKEIESFVGDNEVCLVARNDEFYGAYFNKKFTGTLPNFSTNVNTLVDVDQALTSLNNCTTTIISKTFINDDEAKNVIISLYNLNPRLNNFVFDYLIAVHKLKFLVNKFVINKYPHAETKSFYIYKK